MSISNLFKKSTKSQEASVSTLNADAEATEANEAEITASESTSAESAASTGKNSAESSEPEANESAGDDENQGEQEDGEAASEPEANESAGDDENQGEQEDGEAASEPEANESAGDDEAASGENDSEDEELPDLDDLDGSEQLPEINLLGIEAVLDEEKLAELEEFKAKLESAITENASVITNTHWTLQGIAQLFDVSKELWAFYGSQISANNSVIKAYAELKAQLASVQDFYSTALESVARLHKTAIRLYNECESALDEAQSLALKVSTDLSDTKSTLSQIQNLLDKLGDFEDTKTELETLLNSADEAKTNLTNLVSSLITEAKAELLASKESYESELESKHKEFLDSLTSRLSDLESKANEITTTLENAQLAYISALESKQSEINTELESKHNEYLAELESKYNELLESLKAAAGDSSTNAGDDDAASGESDSEEAEPTSKLVAFMVEEMQMDEEVAQNYIPALKIKMAKDENQLLEYFQDMLSTAESYNITDNDLSGYFIEGVRANYASKVVAANSSLQGESEDYQKGYEAFLASTLYVKYLVSNYVYNYIQAGTYTEETEAKAAAMLYVLNQYLAELDASEFFKVYFGLSEEQIDILVDYLTNNKAGTIEEFKDDLINLILQALVYGITDDDLSCFTDDLLKAAGASLVEYMHTFASEEEVEIFAVLSSNIHYVKALLATFISILIGRDATKYTQAELATAKAKSIEVCLELYTEAATTTNTLSASTASAKEQALRTIKESLTQILKKSDKSVLKELING